MNIKKSIKIALAALFVAVTPTFAQLPDNDNDQTGGNKHLAGGKTLNDETSRRDNHGHGQHESGQ